MKPTEASTTAKQRILSEFSPSNYEEWKAAAEELLKGAPFDKKLVTRTCEGFSLQPIYNVWDMDGLPHLGQLPGLGNRLRGGRSTGYLKNSWEISQELTGGTPEAFNKIALEALENGQTELNVWLDGPGRRGVDADQANGGVGVCGVSISTVQDLTQALEGVHLEMISLYLRPGLAALPVLAQLVAVAKARGINPTDLRGCVEMDPIGWLVEEGELPQGLEQSMTQMAAVVQYAAANLPGMQVVCVQGHAYHNGGGSSAQEMACVLATGVAYLQTMQNMGIDPVVTAAHMRLALSVGPNYFIEIAKFRAMRLLWNQVLEAFNVPNDKRVVHLHARTGLWNKTIYDPYVNMLRTTTEAFSAVVGGCDSLHVGTFDEVVREPDTFSRRIARNTQHILKEECDMTRVIDPAGGSWAVEVLTDQMSRQAWSTFQQIEQMGGMVAALEKGWIQAEISKVSQDKSKGLEQRRDVLVGSNVYPNSTEKALPASPVDYGAIASARSETLKSAKAKSGIACSQLKLNGGDLVGSAIEAVNAGATIGQVMAALTQDGKSLSVQPVRLSRGAEPFERLRQAAEGHLTKTGRRPVVFQLNMGPSRKYRMRADWTTAFFLVGGFEVMSEVDFDTVDNALKAAAESGAQAFVITSDDESYPTLVPDLAAKLKQQYPQGYVVVAGAPTETENEWRAAGVDDFVNVRVNAYTTLQSLLNRLGVLA